MPNYQKGIIYKLCCKNPLITDIYIGSTTNFRERKHSHKSISNCSNSSFSNRKIYKTINENGGFSNTTEWAQKDPVGFTKYLENNVKGYIK